VIVKFLGAHNAESKSTRMVSLLIDGVLALDAGSLASELSFAEQDKIKAILLSHGHYDHIRAVPAFAFNNSDHITKVIATPKTLEILSSHLIDGIVYPEFTSKDTFLKRATVKLVSLEPFKPLDVAGYKVRAVPVQHALEGVGFELISTDGKALFYTGDTGLGLSSVWDKISPQMLIIDMTWPNSLSNSARDAGHLCPEMLKEELTEFRRTKGYLPNVVTIHMSPRHEVKIKREIVQVARLLGISIHIPHEGEELVL
jgi:Cft2 family RNA processing exonuclease